MKINQIITEARVPSEDVNYEDTESKVIAHLLSYKSQTYTKLARNVAKIKELEEVVKELKNENLQAAREEIADLFDSEDVIKTRVIKTVSLIIQITKDPEPTREPQYKDILEELTNHLTPELIAVLDNLKNTMVTVTQKKAALSIKPIDEDRFSDFFANMKQKIFGWAKRYDQKLDALYAAL